MSQPQDSRLQQALAEIVGKVRRFQGRNLGEQNTKASLIEPLLKARRIAASALFGATRRGGAAALLTPASRPHFFFRPVRGRQSAYV